MSASDLLIGLFNIAASDDSMQLRVFLEQHYDSADRQFDNRTHTIEGMIHALQANHGVSVLATINFTTGMGALTETTEQEKDSRNSTLQ